MKQRIAFSLLFAVLVLASSQKCKCQATADAPDKFGHIVQVGQVAPDFEIEYLDGTKIKLSSLRGKVVMLQFTASWCSVCRKEMPHIESEIYQKLKDSPDFKLVGIDLKEDAETIKKFSKSTGITYPLTLDSAGRKFELYAAKDAGVTRNIIIDREGKIVLLTRLYNTEEFEKMKNLIFKLVSEEK